MKEINARVELEAEYILATQGTIRSTADYFGVSKSTVHDDLSRRAKLLLLPEVNSKLARLFDINLAERASRGGKAYKEKVLHHA